MKYEVIRNDEKYGLVAFNEKMSNKKLKAGFVNIHRQHFKTPVNGHIRFERLKKRPGFIVFDRTGKLLYALHGVEPFPTQMKKWIKSDLRKSVTNRFLKRWRKRA